jgi:hypothetical protein
MVKLAKIEDSDLARRTSAQILDQMDTESIARLSRLGTENASATLWGDRYWGQMLIAGRRSRLLKDVFKEFRYLENGVIVDSAHARLVVGQVPHDLFNRRAHGPETAVHDA